MKKLLITNVVYGDLYPLIFCNYHLKSLLDESNLPAFKDRIEYLIFTDPQTLEHLKTNPYFAKLKDMCKVEALFIDWPPDKNRYDLRYSVLASTLKACVKTAFDRGAYLSASVADLVYAKGYFKTIFSHLDGGYDAVLIQPPRSVFENMRYHLDRVEGALEPLEFFTYAFRNMHPLWLACHWDAPRFTRMPDTILWNSPTGVLSRTFSITPVVFTPYQEMIETGQVIDGALPSLCKNPLWCQDWLQAPIIGVEPIMAWYPPFGDIKSSVEDVRARNQKIGHSLEYVARAKHKTYHPSKEIAAIDSDVELQSDRIIEAICAEAPVRI